MSWSLFGKATFSDWIPTGAFADTEERDGFEKRELLGDSSEDVPCAGMESGLGLSSPYRRHALGRCKEF